LSRASNCCYPTWPYKTNSRCSTVPARRQGECAQAPPPKGRGVGVKGKGTESFISSRQPSGERPLLGCRGKTNESQGRNTDVSEQASTEKAGGFHADRVTSGHCHHWRLDWAAAASRTEGARCRRPHAVPEPPQAVGPSLPQPPRRRPGAARRGSGQIPHLAHHPGLVWPVGRGGVRVLPDPTVSLRGAGGA